MNICALSLHAFYDSTRISTSYTRSQMLSSSSTTGAHAARSWANARYLSHYSSVGRGMSLSFSYSDNRTCSERY